MTIEGILYNSRNYNTTEGPYKHILHRGSDELVQRAIETVVQQGTASVSLLQRRLGVGYARAGRLVDVLERLGVISGHEGSKPRTVLITEHDIPRVLGIAVVDADVSGDDNP